MMKHTPGPFLVEPGPKGDPDVADAAFIIAEARHPGEVIATVLEPIGRGIPADNARLLAAAINAPHECDLGDCPGRQLLNLVTGAAHALRSYEYGNAAPGLAAEVAGALEAATARARDESGATSTRVSAGTT
jgi:hypothetical protein